ncbi:MAG: VanZ family protein [Bacilli bacterium]|nr:VanZ family protein [Mollicutes bacterium]
MESAIRSVIKMSWPTLVIVLTIVVILRVTYIMTSDKRKFCLYEEIFEILFLAYLVLLFQLVTSQDLPGGGTNLMPFREILRYDVGTKAFYKQVFGNILLFIPLGYFATSYCKIKGLGTITLVSLLSSITIEVTQHYIGRTFDIDDIILNVVGGIVGFLIYTALNAIRNHMPKFLQRDWFYNLLSVLLLIALVLYTYKII